MVLGLALLAAVLLVVAEFSTIASVDVASGSCEVINDTDPQAADRCELTGFERHGGALILLGLLTIAMGWGAGPGGSRPAGVALLGIGVVLIAFGLLFDLPETDEVGALRNFEGAKGQAGTGLYIELAAGVVAAVAGLLGLTSRSDV